VRPKMRIRSFGLWRRYNLEQCPADAQTLASLNSRISAATSTLYQRGDLYSILEGRAACQTHGLSVIASAKTEIPKDQGNAMNKAGTTCSAFFDALRWY
jgi:hypothetical protein